MSITTKTKIRLSKNGNKIVKIKQYEFLPEIWEHIKGYMIDTELAKYCVMARIGKSYIPNMWGIFGWDIYRQHQMMMKIRAKDIRDGYISLPEKYKKIFEKAAERR